MDPTGAAAGAKAVEKSAEVGGNLVSRLLGPTADRLGVMLADWSEFRIRNLNKVADSADRKSANSAEQPVSARVARRVIEEGSFADDDIIVEYLGGVLASARGAGDRDDRGSTFTNIVSRLSSFELRLHYVLYSSVHRLFHGRALNVFSATDLGAQGYLFIPTDSAVLSMNLAEYSNWEDLLYEAMLGLSREQLLAQPLGGHKDYLAANGVPGAPGDGIALYPSTLGIQLYLWALGFGKRSPSEFTTIDPSEANVPDVPNAVGAVLV